MANVTDADIFARVEAILATITGITTVITDDECDLTDAMLPAAIVMIRRGDRRATSRDSWFLDRTVQIGVLFTQLCGDSLEEQRSTMLAALALMEVVPDGFTRLDRLALNNHPMNGIDQPSHITDGGLEARPWGDSGVFWGCTYEFSVSSQRY